jgi:hypothetical protein
VPTRVEKFNVGGGPNPFFHAAPNQRDWPGSVAYASSPADVAVVTDDYAFTFAVPPGTAMVTAEGWTSPESSDQASDVDSPAAEIVWTLVPPSPMAFNIIGRGTDEEMGTGYLYDRATAPSRPLSECVAAALTQSSCSTRPCSTTCGSRRTPPAGPRTSSRA